MEYTVNQIKMLLAFSDGKMRKTQFSRRFRSLSLEERYYVLDSLINEGLIFSEEKPVPKAKHVPIFYDLTKKGRNWVKSYLDSL